MAQKVLITLEDDIDGSEAVETVAFGLDGRAYEIDLSEKNATGLRKAMTKYVDNARSAGRLTVGSGKKRSSAQQIGPSPREVRDWARSNGHEVPDRGRIPEHVRAAFDEARSA